MCIRDSGSHVAYSSQPERSKVPSFAHAARIASISAWAVGSFRAITRLHATASTSPPRASPASGGEPSRPGTTSGLLPQRRVREARRPDVREPARAVDREPVLAEVDVVLAVAHRAEEVARAGALEGEPLLPDLRLPRAHRVHPFRRELRDEGGVRDDPRRLDPRVRREVGAQLREERDVLLGLRPRARVALALVPE